jgi:hypothetical protein
MGPALLVTVLLAFLFVPLFLATIATLHAPPPWHVVGLEYWAVLITWVMGWVALPFAVGVWLRRRWWPLFCPSVVLLTGWAWNGGHALFGPGPYARPGTPDITVALLAPALAYGALAAGMAAAGLELAGRVRQSDSQRRSVGLGIGLIAAPIPLTVAWIVLLTDPAGPEAPLLGYFSAATIIGATMLGAFAGGMWLRHWWWLGICLLVPTIVTLFWGEPYVQSDPARFHAQSFVELGILIWCGALIIVAGALAAFGIVVGRRQRGP